MTTKIGDLRIELSAETAAFRKDMAKARYAMQAHTKGMTADLAGFKNSIGVTSAAVVGLTSVIGAMAASAAVGMFVSTITEFERLNASLKTMTGSSDGAKAAMSWLQDFAAETPYQLSQVVGAFTKLKSMGLDPSKEALESYGNTAAAMGKDLNQVIEAVADAANGQFERLRDFGITAKSEGDKVSFTFQGVTTTVKKSSAEIQKYLMDIGKINFAGASADQMDTLNGKLSNLKDTSDKLIVALGDTGLRDVFKDLVGDTVKQLEKITAWFKDNPEIVRSWGTTFTGVIDTMHGNILRLGMALDKIMANGTFAASIPTLIPAALGIDKAEAWVKQMADQKKIYDQQYEDKKRQIEDLSRRSAAREQGHSVFVDQSLWQSNAQTSTSLGGSSAGSSSLGGSSAGSSGGGVSDLKNQVAMIKQIFAELQTKQNEAVTLNQEMYEQLGTGAENVAKDEVEALMERAAKWKEAGANIRDINEWLYAQIEALESKWRERGEQEAVEYLDQFSVYAGSLIDEWENLQAAAVAELNKIGVRMDLLDKQDITLDIYLRDHVTAQINTIMAKIQNLQEAASGLSSGMGGGMSGPGWGPQITTTRIISNNYNQALSRSDVVNISTEQERLTDRS